jgi:hypothetical protein
MDKERVVNCGEKSQPRFKTKILPTLIKIY